VTTPQLEEQPLDLDDLLGESATNDRAGFFARLRAQDPVHFNARWGGWIVTRYDDVARGFRDHDHLSSNRMAGPWGREATRAGDDSGESQLYQYLGGFFAWMDPPDHTRFRRILTSTFTPRSVEAIRPRVVELANALIDELPGEPFDFIESFSFHLPAIVISEYLGAPPEARSQVRAWSEELSHSIFVRAEKGVPAADRAARGERAVAQFASFFRELIADRRASPRDDLISRMTQARDGDWSLTDDEIISQCILVIFAGHETTANLLANGVAAFHQCPDQWELLQSRPELAKSAVEEIIRFEGPISAQGRWARSPFTLRGREIDQNSRVLLVQSSANRDPEVFANPDSFRIDRTPNRHLGFGHGIHTCIGAPLARIEATEALLLLSRRFARIEVTDPARFKAMLNGRALQGLQVRLHER
jgi:cytochrome P450